MPRLMAFFYDRLMAKSEEACLKDWRRELFRQVNGKVLEVGAGTGASLELYPDHLAGLVLAEPDKHMRKQLAERVEGLNLKNVELSSGTAEQIEADDESFDYVVTSLVCCSVTDLNSGLKEIKRVLKPGGNFVFLEHVAAAEGTRRRRWQNRLNPVWKLLAGNCHLNRQTEQAIIAAGFEITQIERESMRKALPIVRPTIRGIAAKTE